MQVVTPANKLHPVVPVRQLLHHRLVPNKQRVPPLQHPRQGKKVVPLHKVVVVNNPPPVTVRLAPVRKDIKNKQQVKSRKAETSHSPAYNFLLAAGVALYKREGRR